MKFTTKKRLMFTNDSYAYIANYSNLPTLGERYDKGLDLIRCEMEDIDGIDNNAEDYVPMNEDKIRERVFHWIDCEWDDLKFNLQHLNMKTDGTCVIFGTVNTWNRCSSGFTFADSIYDAVMGCVNNIDFIGIYQVNGHIEIEATHHDGTNYYEIHLLNDRGIRFKERCEYDYEMPKGDITDRHYHKAMLDYVECA